MEPLPKLIALLLTVSAALGAEKWNGVDVSRWNNVAVLSWNNTQVGIDITGLAQGTRLADLSTSFPEPSGIARPQLAANASYFWIEQDSGGPNTFTAVNASSGATAGSWTLQGVTQTDFEDCASATIGGTAFLYMADVGDNSNARATIIIYRCLEPTITGSDGTITSGNITAITCQYPGGNTPAHKDCECLLVDPDTGKLYLITKRIFPAKVYSLAHSASYVGTQTLTYEGMLAADSSTTSLLIGTGSKVFTQATGLTYPVGIRLRAASAANAANFMEGEVTAQSGTTLTINVTTVGGAGTLSDWQIGLANSVTPSANNGCITGGTISPDGRNIMLCNYGHPYPGATGTGGTGLFYFRRDKGTDTVMQALARAPRMMTADTGGGLNYPHSNPPSFPQREAVDFDRSGRTLWTVGEYYSTYGTTTNPIVSYAVLNKPVSSVVLQNGLNGYTGASDTYLNNGAPTTDHSATTSLVADIDFNATVLTISNIASFSGGTQIEVTVSALTGITTGLPVTIYGCSVAAYNGSWIADTTATTPNRVRLKRAFTTTASNGSMQGHTGATADRYILLKFSDLSAIPSNATIVGAKLVIYDNTEGKGFTMHRMLTSWTDSTATWNSLTEGVICDDTEAAYTPDVNMLPVATDAYVGFLTLNLPVSTIQNWITGASTNNGWIFKGHDADLTGDGYQQDSCESATQARKPMLIVRYTLP